MKNQCTCGKPTGFGYCYNCSAVIDGSDDEFMEQLRFMWKEYVLCDESELTEDAKALRAELLDCVKESK